MDTAALVARLLDGDRRALARLLTRIEDGAEPVVRDAVARLHPHTGGAAIIGVTGPPGAGKSTLVSALVTRWRDAGRRVAVLAVDPTSPLSGGALLGDRVRMSEHTIDPGVFVRSMASRGRLGGVSWATPQAVLALDAAGYDPVVVETVGVGQAEVEIAALADTTVVVVAPGMGDAVQAAKAGVLEVADVFCVNKADRDQAATTVRELRELQALGASETDVAIVSTVACSGHGVDDLAAAIARHGEDPTTREERRRRRARAQVVELALGAVRRRAQDPTDARALDGLVDAVARRALDPYTAADRLLAEVGAAPA